jgi:hypothetical protein
MAFHVFDHSIHRAQFFVLVIFSALGIVLTAFRFVATRLGGRRPG